MKTLCKIILLILLFACEIIAQPVTWQKLYSDSPSFSDGYSAVQLDDEGYIVIGSKVPNNGFDILAMRLDKFGSLIWRKFYQGRNPRTIVKTNDGNFLIGANVTTKINIDGDLIWRRTNAPSFNINLTKDGGFYYCGSIGTGLKTVPSIKKFDSLGFLQWEKLFEKELHRGGFSNCLINNDNDLVLIGSFSPGDTIYDYPFIMKTDAMGDVIWLNKFNYDSLRYFYLNNVAENIQNNYMVSGSNSLCYLVKFDSNGNWIWIKRYMSSYENHGSFNHLTKTKDNGFAITGSLSIDSSYYIRLLKTDYDGTQQWVKFYGIGQIADANFVQQTIDSGFIITGRRDTFNRAQVYVIKTDENGNTNPWVNIKRISEIVPENFSLYQNYPNPFNPSTTINYELPNAGSVKIIVYDISGKEVKTLINEFRQAGSYNVIFDGKNLASGVYFYKLVVSGANLLGSNNFEETRRMVLIK